LFFLPRLPCKGDGDTELVLSLSEEGEGLYMGSKKMISTARRLERVFLVGIELKGRSNLWRSEDSLEELAELARSADAFVVGSMVQRLERPTNVYLGKGKLEELRQMAARHRAATVICDDELTPTQQRNLENALPGLKVVDRTALILDVFARRAQTREGRLQVELAQNEYLLPRLAGQWSHLERLGGGIGTRGPGETQIETDRRLVRNRVLRLKKALNDVRRHRGLYWARRREQGVPVASLVGYTNAGKSTLLNALTNAGVTAENKLFSTLDPVTRKVVLPSRRELLLTDTVGFIQNLPPTVIAAFRATLEEVRESALVVHIVDITHHNASEQALVVDEVLDQLGLSDKPRIMALNKIDLLESANPDSPDRAIQDLQTERRRVVYTSALKGVGLDRLLLEIDTLLSDMSADSVTGSPVYR